MTVPKVEIESYLRTGGYDYSFENFDGTLPLIPPGLLLQSLKGDQSGWIIFDPKLYRVSISSFKTDPPSEDENGIYHRVNFDNDCILEVRGENNSDYIIVRAQF